MQTVVTIVAAHYCALSITCTTHPSLSVLFNSHWTINITIQSWRLWWTPTLLAVPCSSPAQHAVSFCTLDLTLWQYNQGKCDEHLDCLLCLVHDQHNMPFSLSWVHIIWLQSWGCEEHLVVHCLLCLVHDLYSLPVILFCWIHIVTSKQIGKSDECQTPQSVPYPQSAWEIFCLLTTTSRISALAAGPTPQATWRQCYWCTVKFSW